MDTKGGRLCTSEVSFTSLFPFSMLNSHSLDSLISASIEGTFNLRIYKELYISKSSY